MEKDLPKTLSNRVQFFREKINLSRKKLAEISNIELSTINNIEEGTDTFLSTTIRQRLSKALKIPSYILKEVENKPIDDKIPTETIDAIKENILAGNLENNTCPKCHDLLVCRIVTLYDLEDNPVEHPKARCKKCPFQIK